MSNTRALRITEDLYQKIQHQKAKGMNTYDFLKSIWGNENHPLYKELNELNQNLLAQINLDTADIVAVRDNQIKKLKKSSDSWEQLISTGVKKELSLQKENQLSFSLGCSSQEDPSAGDKSTFSLRFKSPAGVSDSELYMNEVAAQINDKLKAKEVEGVSIHLKKTGGGFVGGVGFEMGFQLPYNDQFKKNVGEIWAVLQGMDQPVRIPDIIPGNMTSLMESKLSNFIKNEAIPAQERADLVQKVECTARGREYQLTITTGNLTEAEIEKVYPRIKDLEEALADVSVHKGKAITIEIKLDRGTLANSAKLETKIAEFLNGSNNFERVAKALDKARKDFGVAESKTQELKVEAVDDDEDEDELVDKLVLASEAEKKTKLSDDRKEITLFLKKPLRTSDNRQLFNFKMHPDVNQKIVVDTGRDKKTKEPFCKLKLLNGMFDSKDVSKIVGALKASGLIEAKSSEQFEKIMAAALKPKAKASVEETKSTEPIKYESNFEIYAAVKTLREQLIGLEKTGGGNNGKMLNSIKTVLKLNNNIDFSDLTIAKLMLCLNSIDSSRLGLALGMIAKTAEEPLKSSLNAVQGLIREMNKYDFTKSLLSEAIKAINKNEEMNIPIHIKDKGWFFTVNDDFKRSDNSEQILNREIDSALKEFERAREEEMKRDELHREETRRVEQRAGAPAIGEDIPVPPPAPAMGDVPSAPAMGDVPSAPAMGDVPSAPAIGDVPSAPAMGDVPPAPAMDGVPEAPAMSDIPEAAAMGDAPEALPLNLNLSVSENQSSAQQADDAEMKRLQIAQQELKAKQDAERREQERLKAEEAKKAQEAAERAIKEAQERQERERAARDAAEMIRKKEELKALEEAKKAEAAAREKREQEQKEREATKESKQQTAEHNYSRAIDMMVKLPVVSTPKFQDLSQILDLFRKAAEENHPKAMVEYAKLVIKYQSFFSSGSSSRYNPLPAAIQFLKRAAIAGEDGAKLMLAQYYREGRPAYGIEKNSEEFRKIAATISDPLNQLTVEEWEAEDRELEEAKRAEEAKGKDEVKESPAVSFHQSAEQKSREKPPYEIIYPVAGNDFKVEFRMSEGLPRGEFERQVKDVLGTLAAKKCGLEIKSTSEHLGLTISLSGEDKNFPKFSGGLRTFENYLEKMKYIKIPGFVDAVKEINQRVRVRQAVSLASFAPRPAASTSSVSKPNRGRDFLGNQVPKGSSSSRENAEVKQLPKKVFK